MQSGRWRDHLIGLHNQVLDLADVVALEVIAGQPDVVAGRLKGVDPEAAVQLYLSLWNRDDEITTDGRPDLLDQWRQQVRIRWS